MLVIFRRKQGGPVGEQIQGLIVIRVYWQAWIEGIFADEFDQVGFVKLAGVVVVIGHHPVFDGLGREAV